MFYRPSWCQVAPDWWLPLNEQVCSGGTGREVVCDDMSGLLYHMVTCDVLIYASVKGHVWVCRLTPA